MNNVSSNNIVGGFCSTGNNSELIAINDSINTTMKSPKTLAAVFAIANLSLVSVFNLSNIGSFNCTTSGQMVSGIIASVNYSTVYIDNSSSSAILYSVFAVGTLQYAGGYIAYA
jgi:hypothetical protein